MKRKTPKVLYLAGNRIFRTKKAALAAKIGAVHVMEIVTDADRRKS